LIRAASLHCGYAQACGCVWFARIILTPRGHPPAHSLLMEFKVQYLPRFLL
jgi:hypothetical protein